MGKEYILMKLRMDRKELHITDLEKLQNVDAESLAAEYGDRAFKEELSTRVNSGSNIVYYGKGKFVASFLFDAKGLRRIFLMPIVSETKAPNYPSEEYQNIKYAYCVSILQDMYGSESTSDPTGTYWEQGNITIGCTMILNGKDKYSGGDILVQYQRTKHDE